MVDDEELEELDYDEYELIKTTSNFYTISKCSNEKFIDMIEKEGYNINEQNEYGWSLLGYFMMRMNLEKIDILLRYNVNIYLQNDKSRNIFFGFIEWKCTKENLEIVDKIIKLDKTGELIKSRDINGYSTIEFYQKELDHHREISKIHPNYTFFRDVIPFYEALIIRYENHIQMIKTLFQTMIHVIDLSNKKQRVH